MRIANDVRLNLAVFLTLTAAAVAQTPSIVFDNPKGLVPGAFVGVTIDPGMASVPADVVPYLVFGAYPTPSISVAMAFGQRQVMLPTNTPVANFPAWIELRKGTTVVSRGPFQVVGGVPSFTVVGASRLTAGSPLLFNYLAPQLPGRATAVLVFEQLKLDGAASTAYPVAVSTTTVPVAASFQLPTNVSPGLYRVSYEVRVDTFKARSSGAEIFVSGVDVAPETCRFTGKFDATDFSTPLGLSGRATTVPAGVAITPSFYDGTEAKTRIRDESLLVVYSKVGDDSQSRGYLDKTLPVGLTTMVVMADIPGCGSVGHGFSVIADGTSTYQDLPSEAPTVFKVVPRDNTNFTVGTSPRFGVFDGEAAITDAVVVAVKIGSRNLIYAVRDGDDYVLPSVTPGGYAVLARNSSGRWSQATMLEIRD